MLLPRPQGLPLLLLLLAGLGRLCEGRAHCSRAGLRRGWAGTCCHALAHGSIRCRALALVLLVGHAARVLNSRRP